MNNVIWSNWNLDIDDPDWKDYFDEYSAWNDDGDKLDDEDKYNLMVEMNAEYLEDERANLNIKLDGMIIVIADLGLWNGRRTGYKLITSGNIKDCLYDDCDYITWYCDNYNFKAVACHHDGINRYLYRVFRDDLSVIQIGNFLHKLERGEVNDRMIRRYTKSIRPEIAKVYGWE